MKYDYLLHIQIPSIYERAHQLERLVTAINIQISNNGYDHLVLVSTDISGRGMPYIGDKRRGQYASSRGYWTVQIDDDDTIAPNYLREVIPILQKEKPVSVGYEFYCEINGVESMAKVSGNEKSWRHDLPGKYKYIQSAYYKIPIQTEIALKATHVMGGMYYGEDAEFSKELLNLPEWEGGKHLFIEKPLYNYVTKGKKREWYKGE